MSQQLDISTLVTEPQYREQRQNVFPSDGSLTWFIRQNREQLVKAGAVLMIAGRRQVLPSRFDAVVLEVGAREASRKQVSA